MGWCDVNGLEFTYEYDDKGNITKVCRDSQELAAYAYDEANQLVREDNADLGKTVTYAYDVGGNIVSKSEYAYTAGALGSPVDTIAYTYDTAWKDLMASYNGVPVTYDTNGNPLTYGDFEYEWFGRELRGYTDTYSGVSAEFVYGYDGLRTKKLVSDGTYVNEYDYLWSPYDGKLVSYNITFGETSENVTVMILRDENDEPFGITLNEQAFYYVKNLQGDVVRVVDSDGVTVLDYFYDAWGNITFDFGADANLGLLLYLYNPITYRGYYFDAESGMYYLESRYYNPEWCRFLNADEFEFLPLFAEDNNVLAINLFAYCLNNPVVYADKTGYGIVTTILIGVLIGAVVGGGIGAGISYAKYKQVKWKYVVIGIVAGAAVGAATAGAVQAIGVTAKEVISQGLYKSISQGVNFAQKALLHMTESSRFVPVQILIEAIKHGKARPDPQGSKAIMYTIEMIKNGTVYILEVLYDKASNTIYHFLYKR